MNYIREIRCSNEYLRPKTDKLVKRKTTCSENDEYSLFSTRTFISENKDACIKTRPPKKINQSLYFTKDPHLRTKLLHFEIKFFYGRDDRFSFPVVDKRPPTPKSPIASSWTCPSEASAQMFKRQRNRHLISPVMSYKPRTNAFSVKIK